MAGYHPFSYKHSFYCHFNGFYILTRIWYERNTKLQLHNFNQFDYNNKLNKINKYLNAFQPMMAVQMEALRFRRFPLLHFHSRLACGSGQTSNRFQASKRGGVQIHCCTYICTFFFPYIISKDDVLSCYVLN